MSCIVAVVVVVVIFVAPAARGRESGGTDHAIGIIVVFLEAPDGVSSRYCSFIVPGAAAGARLSQPNRPSHGSFCL